MPSTAFWRRYGAYIKSCTFATLYAADFGILGGFGSEKIAVFKGVFSAVGVRSVSGRRVGTPT